MLGGVGTDMERINNKGEVTVGEGDAKHVLIRDGDMYMWGRFDWNPWAPSYPGDVGFYLHDDFENYLGEGQTEFHLFRQCTRNRMQMPISAWHGKDAAGKTIYCGKYMIDDEAVTSTIDWREIAISFPLTAKARIDLEVRWSKGRRLRTTSVTACTAQTECSRWCPSSPPAKASTTRCSIRSSCARAATTGTWRLTRPSCEDLCERGK